MENHKNDDKEILKTSDEEKKLEIEDDTNENPPKDIVAFNELRSCADLVRMYKTKQLEIFPDFQRKIVWPATMQTRFIDSLTKQLPIPSMCFSLDYITENRLVIDGLQRMNCIIEFLTNDSWKLSNLDDINPSLSGNSVYTIRTKHKDLYSKIENLSIPVTMLRCNLEQKSHRDYLFTIFHRLNSGGTRLNNQEIRNCISNGPFNNLLKELAADEIFRKILKLKESSHYRFRYEELILRFFSLGEKYASYTGRLATFLNDYMDENRYLSDDAIQKKRLQFNRTTNILFNKILNKKHIDSISKSVFEGVLIGISKNLDYLETQSNERVISLYKKMREHEDFSTENLIEGVAQKDKVKSRIKTAINIFSGDDN